MLLNPLNYNYTVPYQPSIILVLYQPSIILDKPKTCSFIIRSIEDIASDEPGAIWLQQTFVCSLVNKIYYCFSKIKEILQNCAAYALCICLRLWSRTGVRALFARRYSVSSLRRGKNFKSFINTLIERRSKTF